MNLMRYCLLCFLSVDPPTPLRPKLGGQPSTYCARRKVNNEPSAIHGERKEPTANDGQSKKEKRSHDVVPM